MVALRIETFSGPDLAPVLPTLARLRIDVFRAWPYLYDGDPASEERYLVEFAKAPTAGLVLAFDGEEPVGCSSCLPLAEAGPALSVPFAARGIDPARVFYFGESVLLPRYRGQGVGVAFFAAREAHARRLTACDFAAFCAVERPPDHPLKPAGAVSLDAFWRRRGFVPYPDMTCTMAWKQVDTAVDVTNTLAFWMKSLTGASLP